MSSPIDELRLNPPIVDLQSRRLFDDIEGKINELVAKLNVEEREIEQIIPDLSEIRKELESIREQVAELAKGGFERPFDADTLQGHSAAEFVLYSLFVNALKEKAPATIISTADPSGDAPEGTLWAKIEA